MPLSPAASLSTAICPCRAGAQPPKGKSLAASLPSFAQCCGRFIDSQSTAPDAEHLMRSRYTAYVLERADYLLATWHASTRPAHLEFDDHPQWLGLSVKHHRITGPNTSEVEFVARYKTNGRATRMHERSQFVQEANQWFYVDGVFPND